MLNAVAKFDWTSRQNRDFVKIELKHELSYASDHQR